MLNEVVASVARINYWYWFALGAVSLLKIIFWTKIAWWQYLVSLTPTLLLTFVALNGGPLASGLAMLLLGGLYVLVWPFGFLMLLAAPDPYYENMQRKLKKKMSRMHKKLEDTFEVYTLEGSYFRMRLIHGGNARPHLIDDSGQPIVDLEPITFIGRKGEPYGEILLRGFWDCKKCSKTAISSAQNVCQNCGTPVHEGFEYYTPEEKGTCIAFTIAQPDEMARWPEWICVKCSCHNRDLKDFCSGCGAMKPETTSHSVGVVRHPPPKQELWKKLWELEKQYEDMPFDTPERTKRALHHSLWTILALVIASILYLKFR